MGNQYNCSPPHMNLSVSISKSIQVSAKSKTWTAIKEDHKFSQTSQSGQVKMFTILGLFCASAITSKKIF